MRLPTYKELRRFLEVEGWDDKDKKSPKKTGDHRRYVFTTPNGDRLYTRISHSTGQIHDPGLFAAILRDQLQIDRKQFWDAVDNGIKPKRETQHDALRGVSLDAKLVHNLITKVGLRPESLYEMSAEEALSLYNIWIRENIQKLEE